MHRFITALSLYLHPKIITICLLGFSSGLPRLLIASTLGAWLSDNNVDRAAIGLFAYVALPYSFNFLWAPIIDQIQLPFITKYFGRRRSWMLLTQTCLIFLLLAIAGTNPSIDPMKTALFAVLIGFFSASQDIIIDAYRTEYLDKEMYGQGSAVAVFGYRLGMLVAGAGALALADMPTIGWQISYMIMAGFMLVGMITVIIAGEPKSNWKAIEYKDAKSWTKQAILEPFHNFMISHHKWWLLLLFIALYRMSDGFIGFMATPFMLDIGFNKTEIAEIGKLYGFGATIVGSFLGGALLYKLGMFRSLMFFAILQLVTNLTYILLAYTGANIWILALTITCDNLSGGMVTVAAIAFMMKLCNQNYTATQYALLSSLASLASIILAGLAGIISQEFGWVAMFSTSAILGIPAIFVLYKIGKKHPIMQNNN